MPEEIWSRGQLTPLCRECDKKYDCCRFFMGLSHPTPPSWTKSGDLTPPGGYVEGDGSYGLAPPYLKDSHPRNLAPSKEPWFPPDFFKKYGKTSAEFRAEFARNKEHNEKHGGIPL